MPVVLDIFPIFTMTLSAMKGIDTICISDLFHFCEKKDKREYSFIMWYLLLTRTSGPLISIEMRLMREMYASLIKMIEISYILTKTKYRILITHMSRELSALWPANVSKCQPMISVWPPYVQLMASVTCVQLEVLVVYDLRMSSVPISQYKVTSKKNSSLSTS